MRTSADSQSVVMPAARTRSRVTNGAALFGTGVDGRSTWARRLRDLLQLHVADLGGEDVVTAAERSIIRRIATITVELELLEKRFALSDGAATEDFDMYLRAANSLRRLLEAVGLKRVARDITPSLNDIINEIEAERVDTSQEVEDVA